MPSGELVTNILRMIQEQQRTAQFRAVITGLSGNSVLIRRTDQEYPDAVAYPANKDVAWAIGDEAVMLAIGSSYVAVCRIDR